jgi:hypothetical protein
MDLIGALVERIPTGLLVVFAIIGLEFALAIAFHVVLVSERAAPLPAIAQRLRTKLAKVGQFWSAQIALALLVGAAFAVTVLAPSWAQSTTDSDKQAVNQRVATYLSDLSLAPNEGPLRQHVFYAVEDAELERVRKFVQANSYTLKSIQSVDVVNDSATVTVRLQSRTGATREETFECRRDGDGWRLRDIGFEE